MVVVMVVLVFVVVVVLLQILHVTQTYRFYPTWLSLISGCVA